MDLTAAGNTLVTDFSHGMRKKLSLAAALLPAPKLLFLDEPFEGIDAVASREMKDLLLSFVARGGTIFLTSHILEIVERLSTHIGVIAHGRIVAQGTIDELRAGRRQRPVAGRAVHRAGRRRRTAARGARLDLMLTTLRAFAWLRWRTFVNSLERTGSRDMLERFSVAIERLGPVLAGIMLIPSGLALAVLGAASGYALAQADQHTVLASAPRYILIVVPALAVVGPLLLPAADRTNPVRMLLLPISRTTLFLAQSAAALGDIWVLLMLPLVVCIPVGMAAGGAVAGALIAAVAGVLLVVTVLAISSATTSLLHLAVRDRRRGEVLGLLFLLVLPIVGMLPTLATTRHQGSGPGATVAARRATPSPRLFGAARTAFSVYPTELYVGATRDAAELDLRGAFRAIGGLAATALLTTLLGAYIFGKVLESPGATTARSHVPTRRAWAIRCPGSRVAPRRSPPRSCDWRCARLAVAPSSSRR